MTVYSDGVILVPPAANLVVPKTYQRDSERLRSRCFGFLSARMLGRY